MVRAASKVAVLGREQEQEHLAQFLGEIHAAATIRATTGSINRIMGAFLGSGD
jgi:hypothetical protein